jgi:[ribosomal protein S5]-alanine N-acetyltransferase
MQKLKLSLHTAKEEDAEFVYSIMQDEEYQKHYLERLIFKSAEEARNDIFQSIKDAKRGVRFYFIVKRGKENMGILDVYKISKSDKKASIGYGIKKEYWGAGIGSDVCKLGLDFIEKKLKLHSVEATADPLNKASHRVLEKNGFKMLAIVKDYYYDRGKFIDRAIYWKVFE